MTSHKTCPKCSGRMEEGFVLDRTYGANLQSTWVGGRPAKSFWTGFKLKGQVTLPVTTLWMLKTHRDPNAENQLPGSPSQPQ